MSGIQNARNVQCMLWLLYCYESYSTSPPLPPLRGRLLGTSSNSPLVLKSWSLASARGMRGGVTWVSGTMGVVCCSVGVGGWECTSVVTQSGCVTFEGTGLQTGRSWALGWGCGCDGMFIFLMNRRFLNEILPEPSMRMLYWRCPSDFTMCPVWSHRFVFYFERQHSLLQKVPSRCGLRRHIFPQVWHSYVLMPFP